MNTPNGSLFKLFKHLTCFSAITALSVESCTLCSSSCICEDKNNKNQKIRINKNKWNCFYTFFLPDAINSPLLIGIMKENSCGENKCKIPAPPAPGFDHWTSHMKGNCLNKYTTRSGSFRHYFTSPSMEICDRPEIRDRPACLIVAGLSV